MGSLGGNDRAAHILSASGESWKSYTRVDSIRLLFCFSLFYGAQHVRKLLRKARLVHRYDAALHACLRFRRGRASCSPP